MRYRPLSPTGDYTVGLPFLYNSPNCVAQAILTRLKLWQGEWFMNITDGTPYLQSILGRNTTPDPYIKARILATPGVTSILSYASTYTGPKRAYSVTCTVATIYGQTTVSATL